ncbi:carboxypeptidase A1-like [Contarinia nasturtii]|uniref:carboxypeptidase A1-like n=1 Tax=Contarinia nasturtii TaxID=265458 RepID=UPI0012D3AF22|nr:carboxypeptidase A1-like [Contarinia nasturtii]
MFSINMKLFCVFFVLLFVDKYFVSAVDFSFKKQISIKEQLSLKNILRSLSSVSSPNGRPKSKDEEFLIAASVGNTQILEKLIDEGVNLNTRSVQGMTALHFAADNGHYEVAKLLVYSRADVNAQDFFLNTPLHIASSHDDVDMMKLFIENGARLSIQNLARSPPIKLCTVKDQLSSILADINSKGVELLDAIKKGKIKMAEKLIKDGVDINSKYYSNMEGMTPIYQAIMSGQDIFASLLVLSGAEVSEITPSGIALREYANLKGIKLPPAIYDQRSKIRTEEKRVHEWLQENPTPKEIEKQQRQNGHALTWQAYHRLDDIHAFLKHLAKKYPKLCKLITIGETHEKRSLVVLRISSDKPGNKAIWIDGGIHAREWISPAAVTYIANDLVENWKKQPAHVQNINWHILAVHNPDGYEFSHQNGNRFWRKNRRPNVSSRCSGVDLNRNYGYHFGKYGIKEADPCSDLYRGANAFSEPETEAVQRFFNETDEAFCGFLTFHSFGRYIVHPNDGRMSILHVEAISRVGEEGVQEMNAAGNQKYIVDKEPKPATGCSDEWARSIGIKYAYTVELRDKGRYGFLLPANQIVPTAQEAQAFIKTISKAISEDVQNMIL